MLAHIKPGGERRRRRQKKGRARWGEQGKLDLQEPGIARRPPKENRPLAKARHKGKKGPLRERGGTASSRTSSLGETRKGGAGAKPARRLGLEVEGLGVLLRQGKRRSCELEKGIGRRKMALCVGEGISPAAKSTTRMYCDHFET